MSERPELENSSDATSDRYEELLVNPTLLRLASQRGNIDGGGLDYLLIRYGNFFQFVIEVPLGHVSVALDASIDLDFVGKVRDLIRDVFGA